MTASNTKSLIKTMLDKGGLMPETEEELQDYLEEVERGSLDKMDEDYIHGLARRLGIGASGAGGAAPAVETGSEADDDGVDDAWGDDDADDDDAERIAELEDEIAAARAALAGAAQSVEQARRLLATLYDAEANTIRDMDPADAATALHGIDEALAEAVDRTVAET